ncbi:dipeptidyl peptidase IV N-terminal region-domain-containing protein [Lasiosphaeria miniovina]|uniref:Probable dipeptidyl-aminopeptidase B n=1 Tax=Lasiosphaeria miniovina TaxID=1954250 RepID=A0AA40B504_9PEZI|nr:dipeptidyl peptidase IV N-terminal region-domain-containing protein [Lasiosphaeria miniovina]KAK0727785.1 dipeptidyl peptidase IV N-terminal region-domain-containing protein [Lasiosphaeria miniovina]
MQRLVSICVAAAALAAVTVTAIEPARLPHQPLGNGTKLLTYDITTGSPGQLGSSTTSYTWVDSEKDGSFITRASDGSFVFGDVVAGNTTTFLAADKIPADYHDYWISPDYSRVLWAVNHTKQYRYSYFADYLVQDVASGTTQSLVGGSTGDVQYAAWNPASSSQIAFVRGNNLFLWSNGTVGQVTADGGPDLFNAVPDWVYEEEILGSNSALWFSPDGAYVAFLSFNETGVDTFTIPYYMDGQSSAPPYPRQLDLRYPKVGTTNPTVAFHLVSTADLAAVAIPVDVWPADDLIIGEVAWLTGAHDKVVYRAFNRVQDHEKLVLVDTASRLSTVVRQRDGSDGWLENNAAIRYIGAVNASSHRTTNGTGSGAKYYLDLSDESGWNHIYLFPVDGDSSGKIALTSGEWEVAAILKIDAARGLVHYTSTQRHSTERHLYSVSWITGAKTALADDSVAGVWSASFSAGGGYYVRRYGGPDVPYQELFSIDAPATPLRTVNDNARLYNLLQTYRLPNITYLELAHPAGYTLNAMLRLPANFSPAKTYPVLLTPYGGPNAQQVTKGFASLNWNAYIASDPELEYITLTVDNRGTGFKGRAFRSLVAGRLGELEAADQIWAAKELAKNPWVDAAKIAIWGWSYGGYLAAKVVEAGDAIVSLGIATAPVADWRLYDSMYTERYMKTPSLNPAGYAASSVHDAAGFKSIAGGFLVQHGTGDDNVHFQNSAALVDLLMGAKVSPEKLAVAWFTDSDHSINYHNAGAYLYKQLSKKLFDEKARVGNSTSGHQWSRRKVVA